MQQIKIDLNETRLKKKATQYEDFAHSKQSFSQIGMFQAIQGFVILRGRQGRRDMIFPPQKCFKRICNFYKIYSQWMRNGFVTQCEQLRQVLIELISKFQQSMIQRISTNDIPKWFTPFVSNTLQKMLKVLKLPKA